jgi:4-hydroxybenzoate polyprenyltransferase
VSRRPRAKVGTTRGTVGTTRGTVGTRRAQAIALLLSSHPGPVAGVTAASAGFAWVIGRSAAGTAAVAVAVLAGQLSVGWHNDWLDAQRDRLACRKDKPVGHGVIPAQTVARAAGAALIAAVPLSLLSGWRAALVHLAAIGSAWAYNAWLKATWASILPFVVSFGLLPVFVTLGAPGAPLGPWWAPVAAALLGASAHLTNVVPDIETDLATGVRGLGHRLGKRSCLGLAAVLLLGASLVLATRPGIALSLRVAVLAVAVSCATGATVLAGRDGSRMPFNLTIVAALADVALLLLAGRALR